MTITLKDIALTYLDIITGGNIIRENRFVLKLREALRVSLWVSSPFVSISFIYSGFIFLFESIRCSDCKTIPLALIGILLLILSHYINKKTIENVRHITILRKEAKEKAQ